MTVTYTAEVATCRGFGTFLKLLYRWRGSIYKLVWLDLLAFLLLYYILSITYRLLLDEHGKRIFEGLVAYCDKYSELIPLSFVLGFYVSVVMTRWWSQYISIPWPDPIAVFVSSNIHGQDERGRLMRRTIMRYVCLCQTMVLGMISPKVKKRFPTIDHLIEVGLLIDNEKVIIEDLNKKFPKPSKHWLPIVWAASIVTRARKEGRIRDDFAVKTIIDELNKFRGQCGLLISYDNISVPLVYTQVVTLAVYSYFITSAMGRQWTDKKSSDSNGDTLSNVDLYFPIFVTLEFFFYMGWLKVAESLINPFGEDDDDFEVNWMIDRNLQVSYMIVDEMHHEHPELIKDQYWDEVFPSELPYSLATDKLREEHPQPSTAKIEVPLVRQGMVAMTPSSIKIDEMARQNEQIVSYKFPPAENMNNDDAASGIHFVVGSNRSSKRGKDGRPLSSASIPSMAPAPSLSRVASVASVLKRLFSKEEQQKPSTSPATQPDGGRFTVMGSNASLPGKFTGGGSMKLDVRADVIEEVDEQMTITSMAGKNQEQRPTAMSLFAPGPPLPSDPIEVPTRKDDIGNNTINSGTESRSAPNPWRYSSYSTSQPSPGADIISLHERTRLDSDVGPPLSAAASQTERFFSTNEGDTASLGSYVATDDADDDFHRLKAIREKQRKEKYLQKLLARSVSAQQFASVETWSLEETCAGAGDNFADNTALISDLAAQSRLKNAAIIQSEKNKTEDNKDIPDTS